VSKKVALIVVVVAAAAVATYEYVSYRLHRASDVVRVSGNIEVVDVEMSFKIAGLVKERAVSEGQVAQMGDLVARLDDAELAQGVALRKAEVRAAQAQLAKLEAGSRPEEIEEADANRRRVKAVLDEMLAGSRPEDIAAAEASLKRAKVDAEHLRVEYERQRRLKEQGVATDRDYDLAKAAYDMAVASASETGERLNLLKAGARKEEIDQARASLMAADASLALVKQGPRIEDVEAARAVLAQAQATLSLAETRLGYATLVSPMTAVVLSHNVEAGEYVVPGTPVVTIGDLKSVYLRAYVNETDLGRIKLGQTVRVTTDTYPGKVYEGRLAFISSEAEFTPKNVQTEKERVKLVYRVKVDISNPEMELKPGMPADAEIPANEASG
jgi:HlyD family secretion protein